MQALLLLLLRQLFHIALRVSAWHSSRSGDQGSFLMDQVIVDVVNLAGDVFPPKT